MEQTYYVIYQCDVINDNIVFMPISYTIDSQYIENLNSQPNGLNDYNDWIAQNIDNFLNGVMNRTDFITTNGSFSASISSCNFIPERLMEV